MTTLAVLATAAVIALSAAVTFRMNAAREPLDWWVSRSDRSRSPGGDPRVRWLRALVTRADQGEPEASAELHDLVSSLGARRLAVRLGESDDEPAARPTIAGPDQPTTTHLTTRRLDELVTDLEEL
jgi:hypothetical protein